MSRMVGGANSECQLRRERLDVLRGPALVNDTEPDEDGRSPAAMNAPMAAIPTIVPTVDHA